VTKIRESKNYMTGYRSMFIDTPVPDRLPWDPHWIRVEATEWSTKSWTHHVVYGPYDKPINEHGGLYRTIESTQWTGPPSEIRRQLRRAARAAMKAFKGAA
jgi:hypothetical protein